MQQDKHDTAVDEKWQLYLPVKIAGMFEDEGVVLALTKTGCLAIYPANGSNFGSLVSLRRGRGRGYAKITIPQEFRDAMSFFYGQTITLVCKKGFVEIQPRPSWVGRGVLLGRRPAARHVFH